jgi:hypothetical protein
MTAAAVLVQLSASGVHVSRDGDALVCRPARAVPAELRDELRQHKAELLELLSHPLLPAREPVQGPCWKCGAPVAWRGELTGLRNMLGTFIHLICPAAPDPTLEPQPAGEQADPDHSHGLERGQSRSVRKCSPPLQF